MAPFHPQKFSRVPVVEGQVEDHVPVSDLPSKTDSNEYVGAEDVSHRNNQRARRRSEPSACSKQREGHAQWETVDENEATRRTRGRNIRDPQLCWHGLSHGRCVAHLWVGPWLGPFVGVGVIPSEPPLV